MGNSFAEVELVFSCNLKLNRFFIYFYNMRNLIYTVYIYIFYTTVLNN